MRHHGKWLALGLVVVGLQLTACKKPGAVHEVSHPSEVVKTESGLNRITLTERAMERINVGTSEVREQRVSRSNTPRSVVPHSALIYGPKGETWIYTSPQPRTFIKHKVEVDYIEGDLVVLNAGPPAGTTIASRAVIELYGADSGVGH